MPGTSSETLEILVKLRDSASREINQLNKEVKKIPRSVALAKRAFTGLRTRISSLKSAVFSLKGVMVGLGAGLVAKSFLDASRATENYRLRLNALLGSVEEGNRMFQEMSKFAGEVPFSYDQIMGAATQLSGIMKGGVEEVQEWMPLIADLAAVSGLGIQQTTEQVVRMYSAGAASADLFRERGITSMLGFQAGVSYSAEKTRKRLMEAWLDPESKFKDATKEMAKSWDGLMSMIGDKWFQLRNMVMSAGIYDALKDQLSSLNDYFGEWIEQNQALIEQKVPEYVDKLSKSIKKIYDIVVKLFKMYEDLPDDIVGIAGWGILGRMLFGGPKGALFGLAFGVGKALGDAFDEPLDNVEKLEASIKRLKALLATVEATEHLPQYVKDWKAELARAERLLAMMEYMRRQPTAAKEMEGLEDFYGGEDPAAGKKTTPEAKPLPTALIAKSDIKDLQQMTKGLLDQLDYMYEQGTIKADEYYAKKKELLVDSFNDERDLLKILAAEADKPEKAYQINKQIEQKRAALNQALLKLERKNTADLFAEKKKQTDDAIDAIEQEESFTISILEEMYSQRKIGLEEYLSEKKVLLQKDFDAEIALLQQLALAAASQVEREDLEKRIHQMKVARSLELIQLAKDEVAERKKADDEILSARSTFWASIKDKDERYLEFRVSQLSQQIEQQRAFVAQHKELEGEFNEWVIAQKEALVADYLTQTNVLYQALEDMTLRTADAIGQTFSDYFFDLMQGKFNTLKEIAYNALVGIQRIAADVLGQIARQWLVNAAKEWLSTSKIAQGIREKVSILLQEKAAQATLTGVLSGQIGVVYGLAAAYKALAIAKAAAGMAGGAGGAAAGGPTGGVDIGSVPMMAKGGEVPGVSPHPKADNIPILATAKEFIHPVETAKYYGKKVMEGLRERSIPREIFQRAVDTVDKVKAAVSKPKSILFTKKLVSDKTYSTTSKSITDSIKQSVSDETGTVKSTFDSIKQFVGDKTTSLKSTYDVTRKFVRDKAESSVSSDEFVKKVVGDKTDTFKSIVDIARRVSDKKDTFKSNKFVKKVVSDREASTVSSSITESIKRSVSDKAASFKSAVDTTRKFIGDSSVFKSIKSLTHKSDTSKSFIESTSNKFDAAVSLTKSTRRYFNDVVDFRKQSLTKTANFFTTDSVINTSKHMAESIKQNVSKVKDLTEETKRIEVLYDFIRNSSGGNLPTISDIDAPTLISSSLKTTHKSVDHSIKNIKKVLNETRKNKIISRAVQRLSDGGEVQGHSPTPTSDNIPIWATAKEFIHPVKAVQHYGKEVMHAIKNRAVPKEVFSGFKFPSVHLPSPKTHYAAGGEVTPSQRKGTSQKSSEPVEVKIANFIDPGEVGNFLATTDGEDAIINVLSSRVTEIRRLIR